MPRKFVIEWSTALRKGRGRSSAKVLEGIAADLERFYREVVEQLVPYVPRAAKLPKQEPEASGPEPEAHDDDQVAVDHGATTSSE